MTFSHSSKDPLLPLSQRDTQLLLANVITHFLPLSQGDSQLLEPNAITHFLPLRQGEYPARERRWIIFRSPFYVFIHPLRRFTPRPPVSGGTQLLQPNATIHFRPLSQEDSQLLFANVIIQLSPP